MLTRIYVAGEDAAHTELVRGFVSAYRFPQDRVTSDLSGLSRIAGRRGDGKALVLTDAQTAMRQMSRKRHLDSLLVVIHDLDNQESDDLRERLLRRIVEESEVEEGWLASRTLILLPEPETEGWIAQITGEVYRPGNGDQKQRLKRRAFEVGGEMGRTCFEGRSNQLPEPLRSSCTFVAQHVGGLR